MGTLQIKRIYEPPDKSDGFRILVDRLWPRGVKKEEAQVDLWMKEAGPTTELRKWFNHEPEKWLEFSRKYKAELKHLDTGSEVVKELIAAVKKNKKVTLLYGAKDEAHNQALVLQGYLKARLG
jgi:uncharacterized protein YeaO (DUF488 family)